MIEVCRCKVTKCKKVEELSTHNKAYLFEEKPWQNLAAWTSFVTQQNEKRSRKPPEQLKTRVFKVKFFGSKAGFQPHQEAVSQPLTCCMIGTLLIMGDSSDAQKEEVELKLEEKWGPSLSAIFVLFVASPWPGAAGDWQLCNKLWGASDLRP